jgi:hypothetical protein
MPISADRMKLYPGGSIRSPEWQAIRERIRTRAGNKCEGCGVANYALGGRTHEGKFLKSRPLGEKLLRLEWPRPGEWAWCGPDDGARQLRIIKIVCTVAHVDCDETNNADDNLRFWCQRCHNRHDSKHRQRNAAITRGKRDGQIDIEDLLR